MSKWTPFKPFKYQDLLKPELRQKVCVISPPLLSSRVSPPLVSPPLV